MFSPHLHGGFIFVGEPPQCVYIVGSRKSYVICCSEPSFVNRTTNPPEQSKNPKLHPYSILQTHELELDSTQH